MSQESLSKRVEKKESKKEELRCIYCNSDMLKKDKTFKKETQERYTCQKCVSEGRRGVQMRLV